ncbi:MAG TPA: hypothetical protein PLX85_02795 [Dehalococcoidia bacterium]|nr:hypothetical protein [Dehalococcoidia bacterium]
MPAADRFEVRLDGERRRKLAEVAAVYGTSASEAVRVIIDQAYDRITRDRRRLAATALASMAVEDVPDEEELARQLSDARATTGLS